VSSSLVCRQLALLSWPAILRLWRNEGGFRLGEEVDIGFARDTPYGLF
jgi:hypothetical protein